MILINLIKKIIYKYKNKELKYAIIKRIKKLFNPYLTYKKCNDVYKHYKLVQKQLKKKFEAKVIIQVGFYVIYDASFSAKPLFEKMLSDNLFNPFIVITPDTSRGNENMIYQLNKSYNTFIELYGKEKVLMGYNENRNEFIDYSDKCDIVYLANPYDDMTHKYFQIDYLKDKNLLPFHIRYGFYVSSKWGNHVIKMPFMSLVWKIFAETECTYKDFKRYQIIKGKNVSLTGYCKLDDYAVQKKIYSERKRIIIAPHHTISGFAPKELPLSNFLDYADFFLELPKIFPEIDFIFRPHPILFINLARKEVWGNEKTETYLKKLLENRNIIYSKSGTYYDIFINSDAIIHDCGSFLAEYLITGNPCCYMLKSNYKTKEIFNELGRECLDFCYRAFNENDILNFINKVVIEGNDNNNEERNIFVNSRLKINYPNVSDKIIEELKSIY